MMELFVIWEEKMQSKAEEFRAIQSRHYQIIQTVSISIMQRATWRFGTEQQLSLGSDQGQTAE
jgi:hypothetical protein